MPFALSLSKGLFSVALKVAAAGPDRAGHAAAAPQTR